MLVKSF
ncbi:Protein of unknown function [Lactobacillus helveticus CIRM-BIA 953]|nr:Protein of unknown function [Lactobacillus helveticus CIRM-BIA 953]